MEGKYLKQPAGNNECGFYVTWAMLRYIGGKLEEADKLVCIILILFISVNNSTKWFTDFSLDIIFFERQRKKHNHERLLDMEIIALQSELAKFILAEVLKKDEVFLLHNPWSSRTSLAQSGSLDYCKKSEKHASSYRIISFLFWGIEILIRIFEL